MSSIEVEPNKKAGSGGNKVGIGNFGAELPCQLLVGKQK
jgi:hypothetical protein